MKLLLAVSVIVVALAVLAEPSSADSDIKDRFESFGSAVREFAGKIGEKTKSVLKDVHNSEFATKTRNWFADTIQKIKDKV